MGKFEYLDHKADLLISVEAENIVELFNLSAKALFNYIFNETEIKKEDLIKIKISAENIEMLLIKWLKELLFTFESKKIFFSEFEVNLIQENFLEAYAWGQKIEKINKFSGREIKAITYHQFSIVQMDKKWFAKILVDI